MFNYYSRFFAGVFVVIVGVVFGAHSEEIVIDRERGYYQLDFDKTYTTYIHQDIELMVSLPPGYKFTATIPGSRDFVSVGPIQNTLYISRPVPENVLTNLTCHILTPEGYEKKLLFKLVGKDNSPKVLAIQFVQPNTSELNRTIEEIKIRYNDQLSATLAEQEKRLNEQVHIETIKTLRHWMISEIRGKLHVVYKGAYVFIDGIYNSRGNTYIQVRTKDRNDLCDIVRLSGVQIGKKGGILPATLIDIRENTDGTFTYTYEINELSFNYSAKKDRYKPIPLRLHFVVWSKDIIRKSKIS